MVVQIKLLLRNTPGLDEKQFSKLNCLGFTVITFHRACGPLHIRPLHNTIASLARKCSVSVDVFARVNIR